jgi:hypothetical protein
MMAPSNLNRDIGTEDLKIEELVKLLREDKYLVPTFQREFVWEPENILKLWDSIFRFYPVGSILYWETDTFLQTHRKLGGFVFPHDEDTVRKFKDWKYILDGQQRATSLLVCMMGGKGRVADNNSFDYTLYFDATTAKFFFAGELDRRKKNVREEFLIRVRDVPNWSFTFYKDIAAIDGFSATIEHNLQQISRMFTDYKLSIIRIKGVEVGEVCEIFERINQEGKKLDPIDIIVARTYRREDPAKGQPGFYLRDDLKALKEVLVSKGNQFQYLDDLTIVQMFALCLRKTHTTGRNPFGITPAALDNLTADHFQQHWPECKKTVLETIKFLCDLKIQGPAMLPFTYLALPLCQYFHCNSKPNRDVARQWFWRNAFGLDDFRSSTDVYSYCENFFGPLEQAKDVTIPRLEISRARLVGAKYNHRNSLSRAVLAFLANQGPIDFSDPSADVLDNVYLLLSQAPNLHHIYPQNFLAQVSGLPADASIDSLMNICFLRARTNIQISDQNPLVYFKSFQSVKNFENILESHLIPRDYIEKPGFTPNDYREFLFARAQWFVEKLQYWLPNVEVSLVD